MTSERVNNNKSPKSLKVRLIPIFYKYWFVAFAVLLYSFFTAYYMGPSFIHCTDRIYGLGDSTAGPIWENSLKPAQPIGGSFENYTNYPYGENLYTPVKYSTVGQSLMMKAAAKAVGPVCGYNVFNAASYLSTAIVMFGFIIYLTKKRWIALIAGYAVAYTPYVQSKIGGHPSYGFAALLIATLWLVLHCVKTKKIKFGILLAVVLAFCAYFDPYFILLSGTVIGPMALVWAAWAIYMSRRSKKNRSESVAMLKVFAVSFATFIILVLPLLFVRIKYASQIDVSSSAARGNVAATAQLCSNYPLDYLLPDPLNQILSEKIPNYTKNNVAVRHWCGFGESRVSISLTILGIGGLGILIVLWEKINRRKLPFNKLLTYNPTLLFWSLAAVGTSAFLLGLPPKIGDNISTPTALVLKITTTWRIFAREYLVVNLVAVIIFAIALTFFTEVKIKWRKWLYPLAYVLIFTVIMFEYQINTPFLPLTFSFSQDTPAVYNRVRDDDSIQAIAEYPVDRLGIEYDSIVYYLTMQIVHHKKLFNSTVVTDTKMAMHISMKDLTDPQTIPALRYLGISHVVVHGYTESYVLAKTDQLEIIGHSLPPIYGLTMLRTQPSNDVVLAKIIDGPKLDHVLTFKKGYTINVPIQQNPLETEFEVLQDAELELQYIGNSGANNPTNACFDVKTAADKDSAVLSISINGILTKSVSLADKYTPVKVAAKIGDTILLHTDNGHNLRINNLGCR